MFWLPMITFQFNKQTTYSSKPARALGVNTVRDVLGNKDHAGVGTFNDKT